MRVSSQRIMVGVLAFGWWLLLGSSAFAHDPSIRPSDPKNQKSPATAARSTEDAEHPSWLKPIPVPADPELEEQLAEIQDALKAIHEQIVRRKQVLSETPDPTVKATLYDEVELLRKEGDKLEALLHDLVNEAKASERTAIDEALARARGLEREREYWERKEENIRDRQQ